jgi:hypothetical protein
VRDTGREEAVYNCRVAEYHTYFVGDDEWGFSLWAHNSYAPNSGVPPRSGPLFQNPSQVVTTWVGELRSAIPTAQRGRITMAVAVVEDSNGVRSILVSSTKVLMCVELYAPLSNLWAHRSWAGPGTLKPISLLTLKPTTCE